MNKTAIGRLRHIGMLEGISFLVLLFVAMPLKYLAGRPEAVKIFGWIHGALFVIFCWVLFVAARQHHWRIKRIAYVFGAALIPFGPFLIDANLKREDEEHQTAQKPTD